MGVVGIVAAAEVVVASPMCSASVMIDDTCSTHKAPTNPVNIIASDYIRTCISAHHDISAGHLLAIWTRWLVAKQRYADNRSLLYVSQTRRCRTFFASSASTERAILLGPTLDNFRYRSTNRDVRRRRPIEQCGRWYLPFFELATLEISQYRNGSAVA